MQFATQSHAAHSGPGYYSLGGYPPEVSLSNPRLEDSFNPSLDDLYTRSSEHVGPDGSLMDDSEYAALGALASTVLPASYAHLNYEIGDPIQSRYARDHTLHAK